ncbi:MAG: EF-hand domain-containing protein [Chloroflexota bacterium]
MSGLAAAADLVTDTTPEVTDPAEPLVTPTIATFEDVNGNGIDDDCETGAVPADPTIVIAAFAAVDTNSDGTISVDEAAHSAWVGGVNCNHGGYVSGVAGADATEDTETPADVPVVCPPPPVVAPVEPVVVDPTVPVAPNAHGKLVAEVAGDVTLVGGKNCNHGGAVSEAAHAAKADKLAKADHVKNVHATKTKTHGKHAAQN